MTDKNQKIIASNGYLGVTEISPTQDWIKVQGSNRAYKIYWDDVQGPYFVIRKKVNYLEDFMKLDGSYSHL